MEPEGPSHERTASGTDSSMDDHGQRAKTEQPWDTIPPSPTAPKKRGALNTLFPPGPMPGAAGRAKNHCRRFWWCDLLLFAAIVLVIVLPVIYVAVPRKAQHDVNASTLAVTAQNVTSPKPDSVHLRLVCEAASHSSYRPTLAAFRASLALAGQPPFVYVDVPETKVAARTAIVVDEDVPFASVDQFVAYNMAVLGSDTFQVFLKGRTTVHQGGLPAMDVDYDKVVTMKGLNGLQNLAVSDVMLLSAPLPDGSNANGTVTVPNPSVMTLALGNVTLALAVDGTPIGSAALADVVLRPGPNHVPMAARIDPAAVLQLAGSKYPDLVLPVDMLGNSSVANGQRLEYYEAALAAKPFRVMLDLGPALKAAGIHLG